LHFQSNQKKCKVRHGASNNIKYLGFFLHGKSKPNPARTLEKGQGLAREKRKRKGNARILASKEKKKFNCKIRGVTRTVREDAKMHLPNPSPSGFSGFSTTGLSALEARRSALEAGRSVLGLGRCSLLLQTVRSVNLCFCSVPIRGSPWCRGRSAARARTVRA
jgi:hypothetical protein